MNEIDNKELDRLIEDAVFENAARKQLQALENTIRNLKSYYDQVSIRNLVQFCSESRIGGRKIIL